MAVLLLKLVFWALNSLANLASLVVFRGIAILVVLLIQSLRASGLAINSLLEYLASLIQSGLEYVVELLKDALVSLISSAINVITGTTSGSLTLTTSALMELVEKTKTALDALSEILLELLSSTSEMAGQVIQNLWNNYKDAVGYIMDNA